MLDGSASAFDTALGCLIEPASADLLARLRSVRGLGSAERHAVHDGAAAALLRAARTCAIRVLVLELNAASLTGRLRGATPGERWAEWASDAAWPAFWHALSEHYPMLLGRLRRVIDNRCAAAVALAGRFGADRAALARLVRPAGGPGDLLGVDFGIGDSHRGGQAVARLRCAGGRTVVLITHRLASVRGADRIYLLHDGELVEQGSHAELMAAAGRYAELYALQALMYGATPQEIPWPSLVPE